MIKVSKTSLSIIALLLVGCSENMSEVYSDWEAVNASGSMKRGWIPNWLPIEAINIKERHNLDTNAVAISFEIDVANYKLNGVACEETNDAPRPLIKLSSFSSRIEGMDALQKCGGYFVHQSGTEFYLWKNAS